MAGPFYWAWVDQAATTFTTDHVREDESIFSFQVSQAEGEFAALSLEIRNPRIGLLAPARKVWGRLSWDNGSEIVPLFFGRLVAIPNDIHQEIITLEFTARPADYTDRKIALANTLREPPFYDPVFIDEAKREDPDVVLEARAALWDIDRVTHQVAITDVLVGEDGNDEFLDSEVPYDSVQVMLNQPPLRSVTVDGAVTWDNAGKGRFYVKYGAHYETVTGPGLISDWPKTGSSLGGGWTVFDGRAADAAGIANIPDDRFTNGNGGFAGQIFPGNWGFVLTIDWQFGPSRKQEAILLPVWDIVGYLGLSYDVSRQYKEHVRFTLQANVQPIVTLPGEDEVLLLEVNGADVGKPIDDQIPIGDVRRRQYFTTNRGVQSVEYLIALARAHLLVRSRAVQVAFQCRFERAVALSCRKNALLHDPRLPGGQAVGKVISYSFSLNGDSGEMIGNVTIGCAIGYGGAITEVTGDPSYVDDDYVDPPYQEYAGSLVVLGPGDVGYSPPGGPPDDDGLNVGSVSKYDVVTAEGVANAATVEAVLASGIALPGMSTKDVGAVYEEILKMTRTRVYFNLKPIEGGPFDSIYDIEVSDLEVPAMINLEATS